MTDTGGGRGAVRYVVAGAEALAEVLELCRACYGPRAEPPEWWQWRFFSGEPDRSFVALAFHGDEPVGMQPVRLEEFRLGERPLEGAALEGAMVHPAWRGGGIFSHLIALTLEEAWSRGAAFAFTMPNEKSYPVFVRSGWCDLGERAVLVASLLPGVGRPKVDGNAARAEGDIEGSGLAPLHSLAWRSWRYANPAARYTLVEGRGTNGPGTGLAVGRTRMVGPLRVGLVMESAGAEEDERAALGELKAKLRREGALACVAVVSAAAQCRVLTASGFRKVPRRLVPRRFRTVYRPKPGLSATDAPPPDGTQWRLSLGDWDGL